MQQLLLALSGWQRSAAAEPASTGRTAPLRTARVGRPGRGATRRGTAAGGLERVAGRSSILTYPSLFSPDQNPVPNPELQPTRVHQVDARQAAALRHLLQPQVLLHCHRVVRAALDCSAGWGGVG